MRLYHPLIVAVWVAGLSGLLSGCAAPQATQAQIQVQVFADGQTVQVELSAGSNVEGALQEAGVELGTLDRLEPPAYTLLTDQANVRVIRVEEEFTVDQEVIPYERQVLQTESLSDQEQILAQSGEAGIQEITYRHVIEDGIEISKKPVKVVVVKEPVPEVVMVGLQTPFTPLSIPGRLVYLLGGNAWMMEGNTGNRRPLVTSGDLDGRVFSLSFDGKWLLFTRHSEENEDINTLWAADLEADPVEPVDLQISNIVHFADWVPGSNSKVVFSTVEPRAAAPGWQANNDLYVLSFSPSGWISEWQDKPVLEANSGGVYGWWGMDFVWAPDGQRLAFARPDSVGILDFEQGIMTPTLEIVPLQTFGDWAWVPGVSWAPDSSTLFSVTHPAPEDSPIFDLSVVPAAGGARLDLVPQVGMFAYPVASPQQANTPDGNQFQLAYLQAIFPTQSDDSRYRLVLMDRDGSNPRVLFPEEGEPGLEPQQVVWSPAPLGGDGSYSLAVIYQGDLWLVNALTGEAQQITGDGLVNRLTWR